MCRLIIWVILVSARSNTTPTTLEEFARTTFAPAFRAAPGASFSERFGGRFLRSYLSIAGYCAASTS
jgi:hypothetical protein